MRRTFPVLLVFLIACGPFFYEAPPSIGSYPERIAAKRWQHLFKEAKPLDPALPEVDGFDENRLVESLASLPSDKRLGAIDGLLAENRRGSYSSRRANFLHELRELAADPALLAAAKDYLEWRMKHDATLPKEPPAERPWDMSEEDFKSLGQLHDFQMKQRLTFFKEQIARAKPDMMPYWKVRRGAFLFECSRHAEAAADFQSVIEKFPGHPRAEVAELMVARCKIEESRVLRRSAPADAPQETKDRIPALLDEAESALTEFIEAHPKGRFTPDALGWLGAVAFDSGKYGTAMKQQLARLDLQPTREITRTALRECDRIFEALLQSCKPGESNPWIDAEQQFDAVSVARHPLVARLFVQHCIDPAADVSLPMWWDDSESGGRETIDFLKRRIFVPKPFAIQMLNELGREMLAVNSNPDATTLTLLAWSATEQGEHGQALALLDRIQDQPTSDEAMLARAIILQRLDRHAEAVAAFDALATSHPASPLVNDLPYRRAISLFKSGQSGRAIVEMMPLVFPAPATADAAADSTDGPPQLHPQTELIQWMDTLIQFAPLEQLEIAIAGIKGDGLNRDLLADAIRTRALAAHRFDLAERYLKESPEAKEPVDGGIASQTLTGKLGMTREEWDSHAAPLAALYSELAKSPPGEQAGLHLAIAKKWMENRGGLTLPSLSLCYYAASEGEKQELLRRRNAIELGFPLEDVNRELDHRDEATHALEHALEASKSKDPAIAAPALELANQCLFRRAEFSLYQKSRALETDNTRLSADLHRQLTSRFPDSAEAARSVAFTFAPTAGPWMPGDYNPWHAASALIATLDGHRDGERQDDSDALQKIAAIPARFDNIDPKTPLQTIRRNLDTAFHDLDGLRKATNPDEQGDVIAAISRLDDLRAAASLKQIETKDFINYAADRLDALPPAFKSLLEYRLHVKNPGNDDGSNVPATDETIPTWIGFLETYPDSPRDEAASFRLTRLIARQYRTQLRISAVHFPEAPIPDGYKFLEVVRTDPANDPAAVIAAIDRHEARFPMGRYSEDLKLLRAGALIDAGNLPQALSLLDSVLANPVQRDLHVLAALNFADIAQRLLDPAQRAAVAKAIRRAPHAMDRLRILVDGDTFLSRLKPLMPWLETG